MIRLTTDQFRAVFEPPAIVLSVKDFAVTLVDLTEHPPPFVGLLLELQHPEIQGSFRQFYQLPDDTIPALIEQLSIHMIGRSST